VIPAVLGLTLGEIDGDSEAEGDWEGDRDGDRDGESDAEGDWDGEREGEKEPAAVNISHDIAPSSPLFDPVHVIAVPLNDVVRVAVVKRIFPTSASKSSVAFAHVFAPPSVAPIATAKNPPPVATVIPVPVVSGLVESMSADAFCPVDAKVAPVTA
jgi:hypothetical protein